MSVAPSYSWVYLWRMDNDNWIMRYMREYGNKEHHFMQRFNPTTRKFEKAIEISTVSYPDLTENGVYTIPKNCRCSYTEDNARGYLTYYEDGKKIGVYTRDGIKDICRIPSTTHAPLTKKDSERWNLLRLIGWKRAMSRLKTIITITRKTCIFTIENTDCNIPPVGGRAISL